jgi:transcriptional regulator with XRE-family HTH domain
MARSVFLAGIMRERGISQGEVARLTGLSKPTVMAAYHGRDVRPDTLHLIAAKLGVPLSQIAPELADAFDGLVVR